MEAPNGGISSKTHRRNTAKNYKGRCWFAPTTAPIARGREGGGRVQRGLGSAVIPTLPSPAAVQGPGAPVPAGPRDPQRGADGPSAGADLQAGGHPVPPVIRVPAGEVLPEGAGVRHHPPPVPGHRRRRHLRRHARARAARPSLRMAMPPPPPLRRTPLSEANPPQKAAIGHILSAAQRGLFNASPHILPLPFRF